MLLVQFFYVIFVVFARPHKKMFDIVRGACIEICLFYVLLTRLLENQVINNFVEESGPLVKALSILELVCYAVADVLSIISLIYHCGKRFSGKSV